MESFFVRYRNLLVLLLILLVQIVGLAVQVRRLNTGRSVFDPELDPHDGSSVRLIRLWADAVVSPFERGIHGTSQGMQWLWGNYFYLRDVRQQNQDLQKTVDRLRLEQASLLEDARQGQRLQAQLGFQEKYIYSTAAAQVIGSSGSQLSQLFYIDKGSNEGLKPDMAVITADGIVGKVRDVFPHTAQVLAINDQTSGAGVILQTTRIRGILRGNANGQLMIVGILADERIQPGEVVLTAGGDLVFPRGLPVGVVEKVARDPERDAFINVMVRPAAHLDRLDEVLVLTSLQPRFSTQEQKDITTSQEEKGAEAQAIKNQAIQDQAIQEQLKASQIMAEHLPGLTDPNSPAQNRQPGANGQGGQGQSTPGAPPPAPKLLPTIHPDRYSPGAAPAASGPATGSNPGTTPGTQTAPRPAQTPTPQDTPQNPQQGNP